MVPTVIVSLRVTDVRQKGFEPLTHGLEGRCSIHLSYWRGSHLVGASRFERPTTRTPSEYATGLRHAPTRSFNFTISRIVSFEAAGMQSARKRRGGTAISQDATPKL